MKAETIAPLINEVAEPEFWPKLSDWLKSQCPCDSMVVMWFQQDNPPVVLRNQIKEKLQNSFESVYLKGAYLLSPLFAGHQRGLDGVFLFSELAPEGFFGSEYYRSYYCFSGLKEQVVIFIPVADRNTLVISMGVLTAQPLATQQQLLQTLFPLVKALCRKHWQFAEQDTTPLNDKLMRAMNHFGCSVLTPQEACVVKALMQGHSSKSAARAMDISVETERSYRKSAYAKLGVNSQGALFSLFFQCLGVADKIVDQDPLTFIETPHIFG